MGSSTEVRASVVAALQSDLVGPFSGIVDSQEELTLAPSRWYLTGFLAPKADRETKDPTAEEELGTGPVALHAQRQGSLHIGWQYPVVPGAISGAPNA